MRFLIVLSLLWSSQALSSDSQLEKLFEAINSNDAEQVASLLESGIDVNASIQQGDEKFYAIMLVRNVEITRLLLDAGAKVDVTEKDGGLSALHWIIVRTCDGDIAEVLIKEGGADPNAIASSTDISPNPITPLDMAITACFMGDGDILDVLVKYGGDGKLYRELLEKNTK